MNLLEIFNRNPKAKEEFEKWIYETYCGITNFWGDRSFTGQYAYVLEWLRKQGIDVLSQIVYKSPKGLKLYYAEIYYHNDLLLSTTLEAQALPDTALLTAIEKGVELI